MGKLDAGGLALARQTDLSGQRQACGAFGRWISFRSRDSEKSFPALISPSVRTVLFTYRAAMLDLRPKKPLLCRGFANRPVRRAGALIGVAATALVLMSNAGEAPDFAPGMTQSLVAVEAEPLPEAAPRRSFAPPTIALLHDEALPRRVELLIALETLPAREDGPDTGQHAGSSPDFLGHFDLEWLLSLPDPTAPDPEWLCLREAIYHEARGEDVIGQFAVAEVILNRVDSERFPDTICGVVNQNVRRFNACQFSYACDGRPVTLNERRAIAISGRIARLAIDGFERHLTGGATHYHAVRVTPHWSYTMERTARYGAHVFYTDRHRRWEVR